tara:strand:+ start:2176 stop:3945 length:1770 start_codon:yes stop_codon:yes gene_type:complete
MQGNFFQGLFSSTRSLKIWGFIGLVVFNFSLKADANSKEQQRKQLIELSLKNSRDPVYLDSLAQALLHYEDDECQARGNFLKGLANTFRGDISSALKFYQRSLDLIPDAGKYDQQFSYFMVMKNVGIAHYRSNQHQQGDSIFNEMAELAIQQGDSFQYASALSNLGNALNIRRDFKGAIAKLREAILIEESFDYKGLASSYLKIGTIFGRMEQPEEALLWFRKSQGKLPKDDLRTQGRIYNNMAVAWRSLANLDSAQYYLYKALEVHKSTGALIDQAVALENLARNDISLERYAQADSLLNVAYSLLPPERNGATSSINRLWMLSLELALKRNKVKQAKIFVDYLEAVDAAVINEIDFLELKANYFEQIGEKDSAIYLLKAVQARKSALNKQNDAAKIKQEANAIELAEMKRRREVERKDEVYRYWRLAVAILSLSLLMLFGLRWLTKRKKSLPVIETVSNLTLLVKDEYQEALAEKDAPSGKADAVLKLKSKAVIKVADILYVQSEGHYVNIHLLNRENPEVERISLAALLKELGEESFQRIHRSYAVNVSQLKAVYSNRVLLHNGQELPVTRTYNGALQERFNKKDS